jgi:periplasmic divalent cation tolerance protein
METSREAVLIAKTGSDSREDLIERVRGLHSAKIPCVVFLPASGGNPDYLEWIAAETGS